MLGDDTEDMENLEVSVTCDMERGFRCSTRTLHSWFLQCRQSFEHWLFSTFLGIFNFCVGQGALFFPVECFCLFVTCPAILDCSKKKVKFL